MNWAAPVDNTGIVARGLSTSAYFHTGFSLPKLFRKMDRDRDGSLSLSEFVVGVRRHGRVAPLAVTDAQVTEIYYTLGGSMEGRVSLAEFAAFVTIHSQHVSELRPRNDHYLLPDEVRTHATQHRETLVQQGDLEAITDSIVNRGKAMGAKAATKPAHAFLPRKERLQTQRRERINREHGWDQEPTKEEKRTLELTWSQPSSRTAVAKAQVAADHEAGNGGAGSLQWIETVASDALRIAHARNHAGAETDRAWADIRKMQGGQSSFPSRTNARNAVVDMTQCGMRPEPLAGMLVVRSARLGGASAAMPFWAPQFVSLDVDEERCASRIRAWQITGLESSSSSSSSSSSNDGSFFRPLRFTDYPEAITVTKIIAKEAASVAMYRDALGLWPFEVVRWTSEAEANSFVAARKAGKVRPIVDDNDEMLEVWAFAAETKAERREWMVAITAVLRYSRWAVTQKLAAPAPPRPHRTLQQQQAFDRDQLLGPAPPAPPASRRTPPPPPPPPRAFRLADARATRVQAYPSLPAQLQSRSSVRVNRHGIGSISGGETFAPPPTAVPRLALSAEFDVAPPPPPPGIWLAGGAARPPAAAAAARRAPGGALPPGLVKV